MLPRGRRATRTMFLLGIGLLLAVGAACSDDLATETPDAGAPEATDDAASEETGTPFPPVTGTTSEAAGQCAGAPGSEAAAAGCDVWATENALIVRVQGEWSASPQVAVEYWNDDTGRFRTEPVDVVDETYDTALARLRAETSYQFRVIGVGGEAGEVEGPSGEFTTGPLPPGLQRAEFRVLEGAPSSELTFMDFNPNEFEGQPTFHGLVALDGSGQVVWYVESGETNAMTRLPDGNVVFIDYTFGLREVTPLGEEVRYVQSSCVPIVFHHEVEALPDGSILTMSFDVRDALDDPERLQVGDTIWRWDRFSGSVGQVWSLHDFEDPRENRTESSGVTEGFMWTGCDENLPVEDWSHSNSVKATPDGGYLVSSRHLDQVHSITEDFSEVNWRLGGTGSDFDFPEASDRFYHQHSAFQLPNGNVLLFDNGNTRPESEGGEYSRGLELALDFETMTAEKVWEFVPHPQMFSPCCASVERLENGNTLMVFPDDPESDPCCRVQAIVEADPDQQVVWRLEAEAPGLTVVYRTYSGTSILGESRADP